MEKDSAIYVRHMLEAIANIEADIAGYDFERFRADRRTRQLVERNLEILSEASRRLPEELKVDEAHIPWRAIAGIGNVLNFKSETPRSPASRTPVRLPRRRLLASLTAIEVLTERVAQIICAPIGLTRMGTKRHKLSKAASVARAQRI